MLFGFFWGDWTMLLVLPALIISVWAQIKVSSTYEKYNKIANSVGLTGAAAARRILDANGLYHVKIERSVCGEVRSTEVELTAKAVLDLTYKFC